MYKNKNILLCTYNFPPIGGPRSLRWLNLVRELDKRGWKVDVLTIRPYANDGFYDRKLDGDIPAGAQIFRSFPGLYYSMIHLKKNPIKGFPKATMEWFSYGFLKGWRMVKKKPYALIISSGLPFVGHLMASFLKRKTGVPWVADYGDPLGFNPLTSRVKRFVGRWVEGSILKQVDGIIVPFEEMKNEFLLFYSFLPISKVKAIGHGIGEKFQEILPAEFYNKFVVAYIGSFYKSDREPYEFFRALMELKENPEFRQDVRVIIAGKAEQNYIDFANNQGLSGIVEFCGQITHETALSILKGTSVILYIGYRGQKRNYFQFPYKVIECAAAARPILAIRQSGTNLGAAFIEKNNLGQVVPNNRLEIQRGLENLYLLWRKGELNRKFNKMPAEKFSWRLKAGELERFILSIMKEKET